MIFSKALQRATGQSFIETLLGMTALILISIVGLILLLQGLGTLLAIKWSAQNSRCIATGESIDVCRRRTRAQLENDFAFSRVNVTSRIFRGVIHSEVSAMVVGQACIHGAYDLGPSEYKRVSK